MTNEQKQPLGIAKILPYRVALALSRAAELASKLEEGSLLRTQIIRDAEKKAKAQCPRFFRHDDGGCQ